MIIFVLQKKIHFMDHLVVTVFAFHGLICDRLLFTKKRCILWNKLWLFLNQRKVLHFMGELVIIFVLNKINNLWLFFIIMSALPCIKMIILQNKKVGDPWDHELFFVSQKKYIILVVHFIFVSQKNCWFIGS